MNYIKSIKVNNCRVVNAQHLAESLRMMPDWMNGINSLNCAAGPMPSTGKFLVRLEDFENEFPISTPFDIEIIRNANGVDDTVTFKGYVMTSAYAALRANARSPMVVEVADARHILRRRITNRVWNISNSAASWYNVLSDLVSDFNSTYTGTLALGTVPTLKPYALRYEGVSTLDALQDMASRTGYCVVYDPFAGKLKLERMAGTQTGLTALLDAATLFRRFEIPDLDATEQVGIVVVIFDASNSDQSGERIITFPGAGTLRKLAFGMRYANGGADLQTEAQGLADIWQEWSNRRIDRECNEYFSVLEVYPGKEVSAVRWRVDGGELFTMVDIDAPPEPTTWRRRPTSATASSGGPWIVGELQTDIDETSPSTFTVDVIEHHFHTVAPGATVTARNIMKFYGAADTRFVALLEQGVSPARYTIISMPCADDTPDLDIDSPGFPAMAEGVVMSSFSVTATGGTTPYVFSVASGSLPAGTSLNSSTGLVSGAPSTAGSGSCVFRVTDDDGNTADTGSQGWTVLPGA